MEKTSIPKGTRDFTPEEMVRRNYIFNSIREVFQLHGFRPIETPAMENLSTLLGKYGQEGDKLLYRILNSGNFLDGIELDTNSSENPSVLSSKICEKGLRYDLTVPFARFVVQHRNEIVFPFRRYQIQHVWRADRPQKGRYREFYQCDVDVIGSDSLINEAEIIQIIDEVFHKLEIDVTIKINNRKILAGIAEHIGMKDKFNDLAIALDKYDKIGIDKVNEELIQIGFSQDQLHEMHNILGIIHNDNIGKLKFLDSIFPDSVIGQKGLEELRKVFDYIENFNIKSKIEFDLTLSRGLNYYTGAILEVKAADVEIGSISGGGRYDNLTGIFGMEGVSGVGVSFGADRIYDVIMQLNRFPKDATVHTKVMLVNFGAIEEKQSLLVASRLRDAGVNCELYPEYHKIKKQLDYADKNKIPFVVIIGENEIKENVILLKDMVSGNEQKLAVNDFIRFFGK
jgi:histidyl-tRNA synthetase